MAGTIPGFEDFIPQKDLDTLQLGRPQEYIQPLMDLFYLDRPDGNVATALHHFRKEYLSLDLVPAKNIQILELNPPKPDSIELELLHRLVALEGDFLFTDATLFKKSKLLARILNYRLEIYGLMDSKFELKIQDQHLTALHKIRQWLSIQASDIQLFNLLGDFPEFLKVVYDNGKLDRRVATFRYVNPTIPAHLLEEVTEETADEEPLPEAEMIAEENRIQQDIWSLSNRVSDAEADFIESLEMEHYSKRRKLEQIETLMNITLAEQKQIMGHNLASQQQVRDRSAALQAEMEGLKNQIEQRNILIATQKERINQLDKLEKRKIKRVIRQLEKQNEFTREQIQERAAGMEALEDKLSEMMSDLTIEQQHKQLELLRYQNHLRDLERRLHKMDFKFKAKLKRSLEPGAYKAIKSVVFEKRDTGFLKNLSDESYNRFLIRLIQIHQWTNGYYYGKLDSDFAGRSFDAIADMTADIDGLKLKYTLAKLGDKTSGYWVLNVRYFFEEMVRLLPKENEKKVDVEDVLEICEQQLTEKDFLSGATERAWKSYTEDIEKGLEQPGIIRRVYYGVKSLARSIFRTIGKLIRWVVRGVKKLVTLFKNFIKILFKEIREGVLQLARGVAFLFSKRTIKTFDESQHLMALTDFDFDFDVVNFQSADASGSQVQFHRTSTGLAVHNLDFALSLTAKIIKWTYRLGTAVTWPRLAFHLGVVVKRMLKSWLDKGKKKNTKKIQTAF